MPSSDSFVCRTGAPEVRRRPKSTTPAPGEPASVNSELYTPPAIPRGPSDRGDAGAKTYAAYGGIYPGGGRVSMTRGPSPGDPVVLAVITRSAPERPVLPVKEDRVDRAGGAVVELEPVAHCAQLVPDPRRRVLAQREPAGLGLVIAERVAHLIAGDVGRFDRLLHVHAELHDVQEELQQVLILRIAALHREREERLPVLQRETRRQRDTGALAGPNHVERIVGRVDDKLLRALTQADAGASRDHRGNPAARRRNGHHPARGVGGLDRGRAARERLVERLLLFL